MTTVDGAEDLTQAKRKPSLIRHVVANIRNGKRPTTEHGPSHHGPGLKLASYNIHKCVGRDGKFDPDRTARVIAEIGADVIALQEADRRFGDRAGLLDLARIERETGLTAVDVDGFSKAHGWHGNVLLYKKASVCAVRSLTLPGLEPRGAIVADLEFGDNGGLRVIAAHFGLLRRSRAVQARLIADLLKDHEERPTVLMGDLNEWRIGKGSSLGMLSPAFALLPEPVASFPSRLPVFALDRIICNHIHRISPVMVHDTPLSRMASDHLPIKAVLAASS